MSRRVWLQLRTWTTSTRLHSRWRSSRWGAQEAVPGGSRRKGYVQAVLAAAEDLDYINQVAQQMAQQQKQKVGATWPGDSRWCCNSWGAEEAKLVAIVMACIALAVAAFVDPGWTGCSWGPGMGGSGLHPPHVCGHMLSSSRSNSWAA